MFPLQGQVSQVFVLLIFFLPSYLLRLVLTRKRKVDLRGEHGLRSSAALRIQDAEHGIEIGDKGQGQGESVGAVPVKSQPQLKSSKNISKHVYHILTIILILLLGLFLMYQRWEIQGAYDTLVRNQEKIQQNLDDLAYLEESSARQLMANTLTQKQIQMSLSNWTVGQKSAPDVPDASEIVLNENLLNSDRKIIEDSQETTDFDSPSGWDVSSGSKKWPGISVSPRVRVLTTKKGGQCVVVKQMDITPNTDIGRVIGEASSCCDICADWPGCVGWSWNYFGPTCYLKGTAAFVATPSTTVVSGMLLDIALSPSTSTAATYPYWALEKSYLDSQEDID